MTTKMMTREELLETAALDAFGLLDEYDSDRYTQSFNDAPAAVQDEVRRLQAELVIDPTLITVDAEPPFALRERVLAAVAAAIEREEAQLAPLATIGRGRHSESEFAPHRSRFGSALFWRAAAFVLAACGIVMAYAWSGAVRQSDDLIKYVTRERDLNHVAQYLGDGIEEFIKHSKGDARVLRPVANEFPGTATVYVKTADDGRKSAYVLATALPANKRFTLKMKVADAWQNVREFVSSGVIDGVHLSDLGAAAMASVATVSWQIVDEAGVVVLQA